MGFENLGFLGCLLWICCCGFHFGFDVVGWSWGCCRTRRGFASFWSQSGEGAWYGGRRHLASFKEISAFEELRALGQSWDRCICCLLILILYFKEYKSREFID